MSTPERLATAYHEAGHAVANVLLGAKIVELSIAADGTTGQCVVEPKDWSITSVAMQYAAGWVGAFNSPVMARQCDAANRTSQQVTERRATGPPPRQR
jgi:hypothetical protein